MRRHSKFAAAVVIILAGLLVSFGLQYLKAHRSPWKETDFNVGTPNLSSSKLSPDGSQLATLNPEERFDSQGSVNYHSQLVVRSVQTSQIIATIALPDSHSGPIPFHIWQGGGVYFCDHGKYLLAFDQGNSVHVIDTQTWRDKLLLHPFLNVASADTYGTNNMYTACSANASVVLFELLVNSRDASTRTTRTYDLESGNLLSDSTLENHADNLTGIAVSPAGATAAFYLQHHQIGTSSPESTALVLVDPKNGQELRRIHIDYYSSQIAFAGESAIAVATDTELAAIHGLWIKLWDIQSGEPTETYSDPQTGASTTVGVSADGRVLMAYTGKENNCESCSANYHGTLQIEDARFTLWDRSTGKRIARSPKLRVAKIAAKFLDLNPWHPQQSWRPYLELSQAGNAVLVSRPGMEDSIQIFTLR